MRIGLRRQGRRLRHHQGRCPAPTTRGSASTSTTTVGRFPVQSRSENTTVRSQPAEDTDRGFSRDRRRTGMCTNSPGIARVGLQGTDPSLVALASQSLDALREEFVAIEAGRVKNRYLGRLGRRCLIAAIISVFGYWMCRDGWWAGYSVPHDFRNFFLLTAGTAVGTWLSFSLRRVILTFLDLAALEEDRLDPTMRVLFVLALASVVGLLFWTECCQCRHRTVSEPRLGSRRLCAVDWSAAGDCRAHNDNRGDEARY